MELKKNIALNIIFLIFFLAIYLVRYDRGLDILMLLPFIAPIAFIVGLLKLEIVYWGLAISTLFIQLFEFNLSLLISEKIFKNAKHPLFFAIITFLILGTLIFFAMFYFSVPLSYKLGIK